MRPLLLFLAIALFFSSCRSAAIYEDEPPCYKTGDDKLWAAPDFDDSKWRTERGDTGNQIFWARIKVKLLKTSNDPLGLNIESFGAFEVYWDGILIGKNGQLRSGKMAEIPGTESNYFRIPDSLSQIATHTLSLRASQSYERNVQRSIGVKLDNYISLVKRPLLIMSFMNLMAGAFLIAAIYYFFIYLNANKKEYPVLIFAIICLLFFLLLIIEYLKFYIDIPYTHFFLRLEIIGWLTFATSLLVPLYFTMQFHFKRKTFLLLLLFIVLITVYITNYKHYDLTAIFYSQIMWATAMLIVIDAIYRKEKGALIVLIGLLLGVVVHQYLIYDFGLFISFTFIVLCMLYLHTIRMKIIEEEYQHSLVHSSRLQLELIKKNIQPHFLRNTLTSLIDWIEESPKDGVKFIEALGDEFDIMNSISEHTLIPIRQEIALCKTHLTVMQFRKEIKYEWEETGIDETEFIPPALLHTILENGITHSSPLASGSIHFKLSFLNAKTFKQYTFETLATNRKKQKGNVGGNGYNYIKARLTESYGSNWQFCSEEVAQGWLTTIKIYKN